MGTARAPLGLLALHPSRLLATLANDLGLALQRNVGLEAFARKITALDGGANGATGFVLVFAVAEATLFGKLLHVGEGDTDARIGIPEAQPAHARHIDHVAAVGTGHHLAAHRGMTARAIGLAHRPRLLHIAPNKQVDQARFTHATSPDKHSRRPLGHERAHSLDAFGHRLRHDERLHVRADKRQDALADALDLVLALGEIGFGEHDGHGGTRFMGEHQLALQPAHIHFRRRLRHDNAIEVGGKHLGNGALGGVFPYELAGAGKHLYDERLVVALGKRDAHPVADHRADALALHERRRVLAAKLSPVLKTHQGEPAVELDDAPSGNRFFQQLPLTLAFPQVAEQSHESKPNGGERSANRKRLGTELVGEMYALRDHGDACRVHVAQPLVLGASKMEHAADLQHCPRCPIAAERVDVRRGLARHQHRNRCVARARGLGKRNPYHTVARVDDIAHRLAGDLHGLLVIVGIGVRQIDDGRIVDERRVGSLLGIHQVGVVLVIVVVREGGCRQAREQAKHCRKHSQKGAAGKRSPGCHIVPNH